MIVTRLTKRLGAATMVERFGHFLEQAGRSPVTVKNYRCDIEGLVSWFESKGKRAFHPGILSDTDLLRYREWLDQQFKVTTIYRKLSTIKMFLSWAADARLVQRKELPLVPTIRAIPPPRSQPRWLDRSEQERLLQSVTAGGMARDIAIIVVMLNTGLRVSELCVLRWEDVSISGSEGTLSLLRGRDNKQSQIPLTKLARQALLSLKQPQRTEIRQVVFASQAGAMTRRGVEVVVHHYSKIAGLTKVTPRALRHSFCMNLVAAGVSPYMVAKLAGLGSTEMTRSYYEFFPLDIKQAVGRLEAVTTSPANGLHIGRMPAAQMKIDMEVAETREFQLQYIQSQAAQQNQATFHHHLHSETDSSKATQGKHPHQRGAENVDNVNLLVVDTKQNKLSRKRPSD